MTLRMLSLCSGIGGIDLAALRAGFEIAGQVEINPFCCDVLAMQFPGVLRLHDIKKVIGDEFGAIDLVAGGIPCQPFSNAGKRRGTADDRHLWPYAFAIIKKARPTWTIIENVTGFIKLALDLVQSDLEGEGYTCRACVLPACAAGSPHIRERVFVVAHTTGPRRQSRDTAAGVHDRPGTSNTACMAYTAGGQWNGRGDTRRGRAGFADSSKDMADTDRDRQRIGAHQPQRESACRATSDTGLYGEQESLAHSHSERCEAGDIATLTGATRRDGRYTETNRPSGQTQYRLGRGLDGFSTGVDGYQWPALPGEPQHAWEPPRTIIGKQPDRNKRLMGLGNAVSPQQIYPLLKAIADIEYRQITWEQVL